MVGGTQFFEVGVTAWLEIPFTPIVLDLSDIKIIASAGLGSLVKIHNIVAEKGINMVIVRPSQDAWQAMQLTRMDRLFTCADSVEEAARIVADESS